MRWYDVAADNEFNEWVRLNLGVPIFFQPSGKVYRPDDGTWWGQWRVVEEGGTWSIYDMRMHSRPGNTPSGILVRRGVRSRDDAIVYASLLADLKPLRVLWIMTRAWQAIMAEARTESARPDQHRVEAIARMKAALNKTANEKDQGGT